jgi:dipeptidyl aminopeptidase/acylaminoacyl peptidase
MYLNNSRSDLEVVEFARGRQLLYRFVMDVRRHPLPDGLEKTFEFNVIAFGDKFHRTVHQITHGTRHAIMAGFLGRAKAETDALHAADIFRDDADVHEWLTCFASNFSDSSGRVNFSMQGFDFPHSRCLPNRYKFKGRFPPLGACPMVRTLAARVFAFGLALAIAGSPIASGQDKQQQIADLEKQLADVQKQLDALKSSAPGTKKKLTFADESKWRRLTASALSPDGKWYVHRVGPTEGAGEVILKQVGGDKTTTYPGGSGGTVAFSNDSKWLAFSVMPATPRPAGPTGPPSPAPTAPGGTPAPPRPAGSVVLVNLATGEKTEFEGIRSFAFNSEGSTHLAMRKGGEGASDLLLRDLAAGTTLILGNVGDFAFDKKGDWLVLVIDSQGQIGNGVQIREMKTGVLTPIESDKASYTALTMTEDTSAFALLKGVDDSKYEGKLYTILAFTGVGPKPVRTEYDFRKDKDFPKNTGISANRPPTWNDAKDAIFFGTSELKLKTAGTGPSTTATATSPAGAGGTPPAGGRQRPPGLPQGVTIPGMTAATPPTNRPDLVVWHWKDERLQPMQQVQASFDKLRTDLAVFRVADKKVVTFTDDTVRQATPAAKQNYVVGFDTKKYQLQGSLDGKQYRDVYVTHVSTGKRTLVLPKARWVYGTSPTGTHLLYYADGHYHTLDLATGKTVNVTENVGTSFVDSEDDHNVEKPPTRNLGWTVDGKSLIISDKWDLWKVAADGSGGLNLTGNGKKDGIRYQNLIQFDPELKGIDLAKPAMVSMYGEWTKKSGIGRLEPSAGTVVSLVWEDAQVGPPSKAKNADVYSFIKQTEIDSPNVYVTSDGFKTTKKMTDTNPQQKDYAWSAGAKLIDYKATTGEKLQAALFLPADYKPGKKYPTIVYIYERLSQELHQYTPPMASGSGFNRSVYTSNGYAVLMPDIRYRVNDPGKSAVECVLPALDAAIATGIVDGDKVGLQGHSWGGYQTSFLITQTDRFKAAVAGAPLTNLVSMYSAVYWNSGSANQPIFESSQGRFTGGYWDQQDAYLRNSPVFSATKVTTPLVILHNDKDGAVDFTQGVEYFNTLRRLQKPVVMLQYKGENHGLSAPANRKDYSNRMKEFFDHYLQGAPAPDWWKDGVPYLKMEEHLKNRKP